MVSFCFEIGLIHALSVIIECRVVVVVVVVRNRRVLFVSIHCHDANLLMLQLTNPFE